MNTRKQAKVFGGFKVSAEGRVLVSDLALLQDVQRELDRVSYSASTASASLAAHPHYNTNF